MERVPQASQSGDRRRGESRWPPGEQLDRLRRRRGRMLDALGLGPVETPSRVVFAEPALTLRAYGDAPAAAPVVLIVPAPIKRAYIWDLAPGVSVVQQYLRHGVRVYLVQWTDPGDAEQGFGLAEYADRFLLCCCRTIAAETGQERVFLAGHSLGGTFAAIFASLHPEWVRGLTLLGAPLKFGDDAPSRLVAVSPPAPLVTSTTSRIPGSALTLGAVLAAPTAFVWARWLDWLGSLPTARGVQTHLRVVRWTLDEMPVPRQLFDDVVELLYRQDRYMRGTLLVGERGAGPERVEAPILSVVEAVSTVVPPGAVLPFLDVAHSTDKEVLWYRGDTGVALQHVGMLVGRTAHQDLWPAILRWVHAHRDLPV